MVQKSVSEEQVRSHQFLKILGGAKYCCNCGQMIIIKRTLACMHTRTHECTNTHTYLCKQYLECREGYFVTLCLKLAKTIVELHNN